MTPKARGLLFTGCLIIFSSIAPSLSAQCPIPGPPPNINDPTQLAQVAWQMFIFSMCPQSSGHSLAFENWIEQNQEYPAASSAAAAAQAAAKSSPTSRFHASPLRLALQSKRGNVKSLTSGPEVCPDPTLTIQESVNIEPTAAAFIRSPYPGSSLATRAPQAKFATSQPNPSGMQFPWSAMEVKSDWIQYPAPCPSSLSGSVWTETIGNTCYALAGVHVISKLLPNWIWATFEPQNSTSNPNRCYVLGCNDPFGSSPAQTPPNTPGATSQITSALQSMMTASNLNTVFQNYRLDGVQVVFTDGGNPTLLGNSIIECANAGVPLKQASCITCHFGSSINAAGTDGLNNLPPSAQSPIGNPKPLPSGYAPRDFVWSMLLACPNPFQTPNCSTTTLATTKKKSGK